MNVLEFSKCLYKNKHLVGGKCSSLGELYHLSKQYNFHIADGFATTTILFDDYLNYNNLTSLLEITLKDIQTDDIKELESISADISSKVINGEFTKKQISDITNSYNDLCKKYDTPNLEVAIRSSSISEDSVNASFAGQQDTFLNIRGIDDVLMYIKQCIASLYNTRAISYRISHNIQYTDIKISTAIQKMVRSDIGSAGVAFSLDPESGYDKAVIINSSFGLGELVVSGGVIPDEIICNKETLNTSIDPILMKKMGQKDTKIVYKDQCGTEEIETTDLEKKTFSITDEQSILLGKHIINLENNYSKLFGKSIAVDIEWGIDGIDNNIYILQARPETIHSNESTKELATYILDEKNDLLKSNILLTGVAVGDKISSGKVKILESFNDAHKFEKGDILVTSITTPDWEPLMKISSGIITNKGGRTCHAAIIAREMGLNAVVGTTNGTSILENIEETTIYCAGGEKGVIYKGQLKYHIDKMRVDLSRKLPVKLMMNVGNPESCFLNSLLPHEGVGLVRLEFIISNYIKIHPMALINYHGINDDDNGLKGDIDSIINGCDPKQYYILELARGIAKIASAYTPHDVIVRFSDFKSNEYRNLVGGDYYEPHEENPMIGWRGASRYYSTEFEPAFELECEAIKYVRNVMKMTNVVVMIPFCRTVDECKLVLETMAKYGLVRGENGLRVFLMCEIPSNVIEADEFSPLIDGVSIGGNDLLQLTLGIDRDSDMITHLSDHTNLSYRRLIKMAIERYKANGVKVGFCGQQPSDSVEFSKYLIECGIDSISVTPDSVLQTLNNLTVENKNMCKL
jgi:pyruvate,water dikinase